MKVGDVVRYVSSVEVNKDRSRTVVKVSEGQIVTWPFFGSMCSIRTPDGIVVVVEKEQVGSMWSYLNLQMKDSSIGRL